STFGGDEGKGGGNGCCDTVATTDTTLVDPLSGDTSFKRNARTFVQSAGTVLFTGADQVATADDPWVTIVTVPTVTTGLSIDGGAPLPFTTATIAEALVLSSCGSYALAQGCFESNLAIPGIFDSLRVVIRWDESKIKPGTKPENVKLFYTHDPNVAPAEVGLCSLAPGGVPTAGKPCLESAPIMYTKKSVPAVPSNYWGDIEFRALAKDNGRYSN
ncbi:MAG TPA: hypothetical protein VFZ28_08690, partial [Burkholderiaceae bacterium]|nr:hypothetical protein [Burkholderiaceae bacterium]